MSDCIRRVMISGYVFYLSPVCKQRVSILVNHSIFQVSYFPVFLFVSLPICIINFVAFLFYYHQTVVRCIAATAFLPVHEVGEAMQIIRDDMAEVHPPAVELVDWFTQYYVGPNAFFCGSSKIQISRGEKRRRTRKNLHKSILGLTTALKDGTTGSAKVWSPTHLSIAIWRLC